MKLKLVKKKKKDLRELIDREKLFTMIYSGVENENYLSILYDLGIRDFLMSYHYLTTKSKKPLSHLRDLGVKIFIDSGAYTYINDPKYEDYTLEYWEDHLKGYLNWARENKDLIFSIANFDFEDLVGPEVVDTWNKKYFEPFMIETGIPVCFVWHNNSPRSWEEYCERYPYVGFSSVNTEGESIKLPEYLNKIKIAEKYNSVAHGFGMTQTSLLPKIPYYTVDSTTWLVGLQYGEINFWQGTKMSRLKKDKWKKEYLPKILALGDIDETKLLAEETDELIKANVYAFIEAEKYIKDKLKANMYWLKPIIKKINSLDELNMPNVSWLNGDTDFKDYLIYAKSFNINDEHPDKQWIINCIIDAVMFTQTLEGESKEFYNRVYNKEGALEGIHENYLNTICENREEMFEELKTFFTDVLLGKNDKLLLEGTNFDRTVKERDKYLEEEQEYDSVDISAEELKEKLSLLLTDGSEDPAPDITALDDEIYKQVGVVPVRDAKGKFLKGQKQVCRPKNIYSEKYPKMACDRCYGSQKCDQFKPGHACAYNKLFKRFDTRNLNDLINAMQSMVGLNLERMQRVAMFEILDGGMIDNNLTAFMDQNTRLIMALKQLHETGKAEVLRHSKVVTSDGRETEETEITNPQQGGILERLFSQKIEEGKNKNVEVDIDSKD